MEVISELWQEEKGKSQKARTLPINSFHRQRGKDIFSPLNPHMYSPKCFTYSSVFGELFMSSINTSVYR